LDNSNNNTDNQTPQTYPCTDLGNMERFIDQHRDYLRSTPSGAWRLWTGNRWEPATHADIFNYARKTINTIQREADLSLSAVETSALRQWSETSQSEAKIRSMINMACKHEDIQVKLSDFDKDRNQINCLNGIIDLTSGQLKERTSNDYVSKIVKVDYVPHEKAPHFEKFIGQIFDHNKELIDWVQRALGYSLTGSISEQVLFAALGTGSNGKSTLIEVISRIMNDYSTTASFNTFLSGNTSDVRSMEAVGKLMGMRLALTSEADSTRKFREDLIKQLTGDAVLQGAKLHGESFSFQPQFKLWLLVNQLPFVRDGSFGFWRRIKVIPFNQRFADDQRDSNLPDKLWQERGGILAWLVEGAVAYHKALAASGSSGLGPCKAIDEQVDQYRYDNDLPTRFLEERTREQKGSKASAKELYELYCEWCRLNGDDDTISQQIFSKRMQERGLEKTRTNAGVFYKDVVTVKNNLFDTYDF
jgi:putative DNA primase/helicase